MAERPILLDESYPSNSHRSKQKKQREEPTEIKKVTSGKVSTKKKSFMSRMKEDLGGDDARSVGSYILYDVLIPALKDTLFDMIKGGAERALFGESSHTSRTERRKGRSYVSYSSYYRDEPRTNRAPRMSDHDIEEDIMFDSREDAELVLSKMYDLIDDFGQASVADLYSLVGISSSYTSNRWGWDSVSRAYVKRNRSGEYSLVMPKTILLD